MAGEAGIHWKVLDQAPSLGQHHLGPQSSLYPHSPLPNSSCTPDNAEDSDNKDWKKFKPMRRRVGRWDILVRKQLMDQQISQLHRRSHIIGVKVHASVGLKTFTFPAYRNQRRDLEIPLSRINVTAMILAAQLGTRIRIPICARKS